MNIQNQVENNYLIKNAVEALDKDYPDNISFVKEEQVNASFLVKQDLMLVSLQSWKKLVATNNIWLSNLPSVLIIKP